MILIDSLYINTGGGLVLLKYLVDCIENCNIKYHLLVDQRCSKTFEFTSNHTILKASLLNRYRFYVKNRFKYSSVLCFGNVPPPIKLDVPVYTYFHNINLLTLNETTSFINYIKSLLKQCVFKCYKLNTTFWLVQTENTATELINNLSEDKNRVLQYPFFNISDKMSIIKGQTNRLDYILVGDYYWGTKGHDTLLDAWEILFSKGINKRLHLTINETTPSNNKIIKRIRDLQERGLSIINHGFIPFEEMLDIYKKAKAIVYPSHNESLGLGIIEALHAGCDVLSSDLPYTYSICKPSAVFDPYNPQSIVDAIIIYESGKCGKSELTIKNRIYDLIDLVVVKNSTKTSL